MSKFGWSYPAGAENDPNAPYNQEDGFNPYDFWENNGKALAEAFPDYEGPGPLYRYTYKYTDCGPTVGVRLSYNVTDPETGTEDVQSRDIYCDELYKLAPWTGETARSAMIAAFLVSSIVEGVDQCTDTIEVEVFDMEHCHTRVPKDIAQDFWDAVEEVNKQAENIWLETHGCDRCEKETGTDEFGQVAIWEDCPECSGQGAMI